MYPFAFRVSLTKLVQNRDPFFLLAAVLLHGLAVGAVWTSASSALQTKETSAVDSLDGSDLYIDLEPIPPREIAVPVQPATRVPIPIRSERRAPRANVVAPQSNDAMAEETAQEPRPVAETPDIHSPLTVSPSGPPGPLPGIDGQPIWAVPGVLPTGTAMGGAIRPSPAPVIPAPPANTGTVTKVLDYLASGNPPKSTARIAPSMHFPAAGTLASSLANEVRSSSTPPDSNGIFELVIDALGHLVSVQVIAADPKYRQEWERVARVVASRFSGQPFPLPDAYAQGSRIRVAVTSKMTMPDGTSHGIPSPSATIPGLPGEHDIHVDALDDPYRGGAGKAGLPPTNLAVGIKFELDLANIGAKRRRIVQTRVTAAPLARPTSAGAADPHQ